MEDITTRTIVIGVGIFVTLTILTIIIMIFSQMSQIYGIVATTDNSIAATFDNIYAMYDGRTMTGLGLLNTIKKYESNTGANVIISYPGSETVREHVSKNGNIRESVYLKELMEKNEQYKYETKYDVSVHTQNATIIVITFVKR